MFYTVIEEKCAKGMKERYSVGQRISKVDISKLKDDMDEYYYWITESKEQMYLEFYKLGVFRNEVFVYSLKLKPL